MFLSSREQYILDKVLNPQNKGKIKCNNIQENDHFKEIQNEPVESTSMIQDGLVTENEANIQAKPKLSASNNENTGCNNTNEGIFNQTTSDEPIYVYTVLENLPYSENEATEQNEPAQLEYNNGNADYDDINGGSLNQTTLDEPVQSTTTILQVLPAYDLLTGPDCTSQGMNSNDCNGTVIKENKKCRWSCPRPSEWAVMKNKSLRKSGQPYKSKTGRLQPAKLPKLIDCSKCLYNCKENFSNEFRLKIFREYHNLPYERQKDFLLQLVASNPVERKRKRDGSGLNRTTSKKYFFIKDGEKLRVCKNYFLKTLSISHGPVDHAIKNQSDDSGSFSKEDKRGKKEPPNKTAPAVVKKIKDHIEKFPTQESHYCRKTSKRKYLDSRLTISKMYELFQNEWKSNLPIPSEYIYRQIFCKEYNLSFFKPKKDQCVLCTNYQKARLLEKQSLENEYSEHVRRKDEAMKCKAADKERCLTENNFMSATFDLQSVLQIPCSEVSQLYYSRKLSAFNLTIYEAAPPSKGHCFSWTEVNGQRGSSEIGTALFHWLQTLPDCIEEVSLFLDTCSGQNRNQYIAALFLYTVQNLHFRAIEHKFLESGHSYMEVDSMHSAIESAKRNVPVYVMQDWLNIFMFARSKRNRNKSSDPYTVRELRFDDFLDLKDLAGRFIRNRIRDTENNQVKWLKIKRMRYEKEKKGCILFSYDYTGPYKELNVIKKGQSCNIPAMCKKLYNKKIPITYEKKNDLLKLCKSKIIPEEYHHFYETLLATAKQRNRNPEPDVLSTSDSE